MSDDWLEQGFAAASGASGRHLRVLRELLGRDYLARADWGYALRDLADMARTALEANAALVALWNPAAGAWSAVTHGGTRLADADISGHGSRSALDRVRRTDKPILAAAGPELRLDSESLRAHDVESILVVPLHFWDVTAEQPERQFAGCLYAHRTSSQATFTPGDIEIGVDIARLAQPILNLLRYLRDVQTDLAASKEQLERLRRHSAKEYRLGQYRTSDPWFAQNVLEPLNRIRHAEKVNVLILGPTGSGKTHLAEAYHSECPRRDGPFIVLDCSQITSVETLAAELFGYAPDSGYANAPRGGRPGKAQLAHRGTLFVDEIGCLPAELQQKLLRLIDEGTFSPLGSSEQREVDLQLLAATNTEPSELVSSGQFREDLYWRISDVTIRLPPLSERVGDIPHLAQAFLEKACERCDRKDLQGLTERALHRLLQHDWARAGNIRGLERTMLRSVLLAPPGLQELDEEHVQLQELTQPRPAAPEAVAAPGPRSAAKAQETPELAAIKAAIREHGYASAAAKALGISYRQLTWQLHKVGLSIRDVLAGNS
jgi:transcriptional regulator with GAF, ATPase, and Fis domain